MKRAFSIIGMIAGAVLILMGILTLAGAFGGKPSDSFEFYSVDNNSSYSGSLYDKGYASFGGDFYTYVSNNAYMAAVAARDTADNVADTAKIVKAAAANSARTAKLIKTSCGIGMLFAGLFAFCGFGASLGKANEFAPAPVASEHWDKPASPASSGEMRSPDPVPSAPVWNAAQDQPVWNTAQNQPVWNPAQNQPVWNPAQDQPVWNTAQNQPVWNTAQNQPAAPARTPAQSKPAAPRAEKKPVEKVVEEPKDTAQYVASYALRFQTDSGMEKYFNGALEKLPEDQRSILSGTVGLSGAELRAALEKIKG